MMYLRNDWFPQKADLFLWVTVLRFERGKGISLRSKEGSGLLSEAGFPDGKGLPTIKLLTVPVYVQSWQNLLPGSCRKLACTGGSDSKACCWNKPPNRRRLFRASWIGDYPDAENFLNVFLAKSRPSQLYPLQNAV